MMNANKPEILSRKIRNFACTFNPAHPSRWHVEHLAVPRFVLTVTEPWPGACLEETVHWIDGSIDLPETLNRELGEVLADFVVGQGNRFDRARNMTRV